MDNIYKEKPLIAVTAPSWAGKTTLVRYLLEIYDVLDFSVSSTTRPIRWTEVDGIDYHFLTLEQMQDKISDWKMLERAEVYPGKIYGTDKDELKKIRDSWNIPILDIDLEWALNVKSIYPKSLGIFISPPDINTLRTRLISRNTETQESIQTRIDKAEYEISHAHKFDFMIRNIDLDMAKKEIAKIVWDYIQ